MLLDKCLSAGKCSVAYKATPLAGLAWLDEARRGDSVQNSGNFAQKTEKPGLFYLGFVAICCKPKWKIHIMNGHLRPTDLRF
jgi:hypothetical protein